MSYEPNTINIKVYTPGGLQAFACIPITESMMASDIDNWVATHGFLAALPGTEPGEDVETMTHVIKCTQHNNDGTTTPCIGLYYENQKLEFARKAYLDTPEQQAAFEAVSGLKIAQLPEFPTATLPKRSDKSAARFIVAAPTPFKVVIQPHRYTDDDGNEKTTQRFGRFFDAPTTPDNVTTLPTTGFTRESADTFVNKWRDKGLTDEQILGGLGVQRLSEWQKSIEDADQTLSILAS